VFSNDCPVCEAFDQVLKILKEAVGEWNKELDRMPIKDNLRGLLDITHEQIFGNCVKETGK
jgi:hypothetical protein